MISGLGVAMKVIHGKIYSNIRFMLYKIQVRMGECDAK